jgi:hypothetical protein
MNKQLTCTPEQVHKWKPCDRKRGEKYSPANLRKLYASHGKTRATALDIIGWQEIPVDDRFWAVLREDLIPSKILHEFACREAHRALMAERKAGREPDPRSWAAIQIKRQWLRDAATDAQLAAALSAVWSVAWLVACEAARDVAREAQITRLRRMLMRAYIDTARGEK